MAKARAAERVIRSGHYILGEEVNRFETRFAEWSGLPRVAGTGNGMDAIEIGLRALGIGKGDQVITTPMTAFATVLAIVRAGAEPVLADIDPHTAILDAASARRCITRRTKGVLLVHLYGRMADMDEWSDLCVRHGLALLEDCAQAHGARWCQRPVGSFGLFGAFSFYPTKNLGCVGDGGALATATAELDAKARMLRDYGQSSKYVHAEIGLNSRLDEIQAAIMQERIRWLDSFTARRREIARAYRNGISNSLVRHLAPPGEPECHVFHQYVILCETRDALSAHLRKSRIETLIHYPVPAHLQPPTRDAKRDRRGLTMSETHANTCLSLPCHPCMSDTDVAQVIDAVNAYR